ncbi:MAG: hemerythrin domain-containing protein [Rhizobacter sp.]|nr:hemerythrin domain-containing protein [Rhizobacter sp.]
MSHALVAVPLAEHGYVAHLLDALQRRVKLHARGLPIERDGVGSVMQYLTEYPDAYHHAREGAIFARLEKRAPDLRKRIAAIECAHRSLGAAAKDLLAAARRPREREEDESELAALIASYLGAQRQHMSIEERHPFPRATCWTKATSRRSRHAQARHRPDLRGVRPRRLCRLPGARAVLVDKPALSQALDVLDAFFESPATLGEALFGARAIDRPAASGRGPALAARKRRWCRHALARARERRVKGAAIDGP